MGIASIVKPVLCVVDIPTFSVAINNVYNLSGSKNSRIHVKMTVKQLCR